MSKEVDWLQRGNAMPDQVQSLQRALRRWRMMALTSWGPLGLLLVGGGVLLAFQTAWASQERLRAEQALREAQVQMERAQQAEEGARK